jgi:hypothetical protein
VSADGAGPGVAAKPVPVEMWFDPTCPHSWKTSRWLTGLSELGVVSITWHVMSLAILNEGKAATPERAERRARSVPILRTLEAVREGHGNDAVGAVYSALGGQIHDQGADLGEDALRRALDQAGLPGDLLAAGASAARQEDVRKSHHAGQQRVGTPTGSPVIAIGTGRGFFGPVITSVPQGQDAVTLLHAVELLSGVTEFSELKGSR